MTRCFYVSKVLSQLLLSVLSLLKSCVLKVVKESLKRIDQQVESLGLKWWGCCVSDRTG